MASLTGAGAESAAGRGAAAPQVPEWLVVLIAGLLMLAFGLAAYTESLSIPPMDDSDEATYLTESAWIHEHGGIPGFVLACLKGEYPYEYNHPLVQVLASPVADYELQAILPMRAVKVELSVLALVLTFAVAWRIVGPTRALQILALLALSRNWYTKSRVLTTEPVIYALILLGWALVAGRLRPKWRWLWAGAACGLAFLTKGTALLLLLALPPAICLHLLVGRLRRKKVALGHLWRPWALKSALPFLIGFVVVAGVLMARNTVRRGNPLFSKNSLLMWADSWDQHPEIAEDIRLERFTPWQYVKRHTFGELAGRLIYGLKKQAPRLATALMADPGFTRPVMGLTLIASLIVMAVGLARLVRDGGTLSGQYTLVLLALGLALFAWYAIHTYASRFAATLAPMIVFYAFLDAPPLTRGSFSMRRLAGWAALPVAALATALLAGRIDTRALLLPPTAPPATPEYRFLLDWHRREVGVNGAVCFQTPYLAPRYAINWLVRGQGAIYPIPGVATFAELQKIMDERGAKYLVIERDSLADRKAILSEWFYVDEFGALKMRGAPPGWRVSVVDPYGSTDFIILERANPAVVP